MREHGIDYFENSRRATLAQRAYAIANPEGYRGYGERLWGLSACDGPLDGTVTVGGRAREFHTYQARGASFTRVTDDGTIAPTAAAASIAFAPELVIPALLSVSGCARPREATPLRFWAMGREGEVVQELVRDFERENPGIRVVAQQIPWSAAHEKLLTAFVGGSLPDVIQLGNTWIPEFAALKALAPLDSALSADSAHVPRADYFPGVLATNVVDDTLYGVPWYVDT